jgi:hypothetical protein
MPNTDAILKQLPEVITDLGHAHQHLRLAQAAARRVRDDFHPAWERDAVEVITRDGGIARDWAVMCDELAAAEESLGDAAADLESHLDDALADEAAGISHEDDNDD